MKLTGLFALLICQLANAQTNFFPVLHCTNRTYTNATIVSVTPATVLIDWDGGGESIPITNLAPELLIRYHYDPAKAAKFLEDENQRKKAFANAQEAAQKAAAKRAMFNAVEDKIEIKFDPIRETVTWKPKERINVISDVFKVGFFALLDQSQGKLTTNGTRLSFKPFQKPESVTMTITAVSKEWAFLHSHDFIVVYGGRRKDFGELEHHGDVMDGAVLEQFFADFTFSEFRDLSSAASFKAVLGRLPFELSYEDRDAMRAFVNYFDTAVTSETNGTTPPPKRKP